LIGHLFDLGLLKEMVIMACLYKLIQNDEDPSDDIVENLIQFVKTIGKKLDTRPETRGKLNIIFDTMKKMSTQPKIPRRLQFALLDLIDLRAQGWRGGDADVGPKTLKEIHEEENKKHMEDQRQKSEKKKGNYNDSRSNSSRNPAWSNSNRVNESDFKNVGRVGSPSSSALGPQNYFGKSKSQQRTFSSNESSSTPSASSPLSARENSLKPAANAFAVLNEHNGDSEEEHHEEEEHVKEETKEDEGKGEKESIPADEPKEVADEVAQE
jgi:translation initiation factor 4G